MASRRFFDGAQTELGLLTVSPGGTPPGEWTTFTDGTSGSTGATVTGLTNDQPYEFRVAAVNSEGQGDWSNIAGPYTPESSGATLVVADASSASTVDGLTLVQHQILTVADARSTSTVDNVALTQHQLLAVADATSGSTVDNLDLVQHHLLVVADATSATRADRVVVTNFRYPVSIDATNDVWLDQYGDRIFLAGDTGWALSAQTAADIDDYLEGIAALGFRLSLVSAPEPYFTANTPDYRNNNGDDPFVGTSFQSALNEAYWANWDHAVEKAHELGIVLLITPFYLGFNDTEGWRETLTAAYNANPTNLTNYGAAIAARYAPWPNIMWLIGHDDASLTTQTESASELIAAELASGTAHLITVGAARGALGSATWSTTSVAYDYDTIYYDELTPGEDTAAGIASTGTGIWVEGRYEQEGAGPVAIGAQVLREQMWEPFMAGASASIFGNNPRWHFGLAFGGGGKAIFDYSGTWQQSLTNATYNVGSVHAGLLATFVNSIADVLETTPDTGGTFLVSGTGFARFSTTVGVAYQTAAASITLDTTELSGTGNIRLRRWDPTTGTWATGGAALDVTEAQNATRAISHPGNNANGQSDWVYVVTLSTATALTVNDAVSPSTVDGVALVQHHVLAVADATSTSTADNLTLTQHQVLAVADATSASTVDGLSLTQHQVLAVAGATSASTIDNVALTQHHVLAVADAASASTIDGLALVQHHALAVADATSASTIDNLSLAANTDLVVVDATSATTIDSVALVQHQLLAIADATSTSTIDGLALTQHQVLAVADASSTSTIGAVALVQHQILAVADSSSSTTIDNVALTQHQVLAVNDAASTSTIDSITVTPAGQLAVQDATAASTIDNVSLVQHQLLAVTDATSSSTIDNLDLVQGATLTVADATSTSTIDGLALVQHQALAVSDARSSSTIDGPTLTQHHLLTVADASSTSTVDALVLAQHVALTVSDARSSSTIDAVSLAQHHVLTVADARSTSTIDTVSLDSDNNLTLGFIVSVEIVAPSATTSLTFATASGRVVAPSVTAEVVSAP